MNALHARPAVLLEIVSLGFALGMALFSALAFTLYWSGMTVGLGLVIALLLTGLVMTAALRMLAGVRLREPAVHAPASRMAVSLGLGIAALQVTLSAALALRWPIGGWDGWAIWALKGRMFAQGGPRLDYFHDQTMLFSHPDYPLNLPLAEAALFHLPESLGVRFVALLGPACLAALLGLFYAGLRRIYGPAVAALATGALACVPLLPRQAATGYADVPLALYAGAASLYLLLWWRLERRSDLLLMGLLAGGAAWTKKEGLVVAALLLLAALIGEAVRPVQPLRVRLRRMAIALIAVLALPLPWLAFSLNVRPSSGDFMPFTPDVFFAHLNRLPHIVRSLTVGFLNAGRWGLFWVLVVAGVATGARRLSPAGRGLLALLTAQLAAACLFFVFSSWQPYTEHVDNSLYRLVMQAAPLAMLVLVETVLAAQSHWPGTLGRLSDRMDRAISAR